MNVPRGNRQNECRFLVEIRRAVTIGPQSPAECPSTTGQVQVEPHPQLKLGVLQIYNNLAVSKLSIKSLQWHMSRARVYRLLKVRLKFIYFEINRNFLSCWLVTPSILNLRYDWRL